MTEYAYNDRLSKLEWAGCKNLWAHGGLAMDRTIPSGFHTAGVPGILVDDRLGEWKRDVPLPSKAELDDLIRGLVDDQGEQDEYEPLFIVDHAQIDGHDLIHIYRVAFRQEAVWTMNHQSYGWISFNFLADLIQWVEDNDSQVTQPD